MTTTSITVFAMGITGVFCGMALIYLSIKATAFAVDFLSREKETS